MNFKEILSMMTPKWLRRAVEPLPPAKELRADFRRLSKEIADETVEIKTLCDERRRESQTPVSNGTSH